MNLNKENYVILVTTLASFMVAYISIVPTVALPSMAQYFGLSNIMQNWVINAFLFTVAIFAVPTGNLAGKYGIKRSFEFGSLIFLIGVLVIPFAFSPLSLILFRALQGFGAAIIYNTVMNIVTMGVLKENRGKAIGIVIAGVNLGIGLAPVLGGVLSYNFGWQSIFLFAVPFGIIYQLVSRLMIKDEWEIGKENKFDKKGAVLWGVAIFFFVYGFTIIKEIEGILMLLSGILLLIGFVFFELKSKYPVYDIRAFENRIFASSNFAAVLSFIATYSFIYILNYHVQYIMGFNSEMAGLILFVTPFVQIIVSPPAGRLSDRFNSQMLEVIGMGLVAVSLFVLIFLNESTPLSVILIAMILEGVGYAIFSAPNTNLIMSSLKEEDSPVASVSVTLMRVLGQTMSLAMLTTIFNFIMGDVAIVPKYYPLLILSSNMACIVGTVLAVVTILLCLIGLIPFGKRSNFFK